MLCTGCREKWASFLNFPLWKDTRFHVILMLRIRQWLLILLKIKAKVFKDQCQRFLYANVILILLATFISRRNWDFYFRPRWNNVDWVYLWLKRAKNKTKTKLEVIFKIPDIKQQKPAILERGEANVGGGGNGEWLSSAPLYCPERASSNRAGRGI